MSCHSYAFVPTFGGDVHLATLHSSVILAVINNTDKVVTVMAVCVNLIVHVFCYYISSILFDLTIRELNVIYHCVQKRVIIIGSVDVTISILASTYHLSMLIFLPLRQTYFEIDPVISHGLLKSSNIVRIHKVCIFRKGIKVWIINIYVEVLFNRLRLRRKSNVITKF